MSNEPAFGTALVGQVENAFGAILDRQLAGTGLGAPEWITLTVAVRNGGSIELEQLVRRVAGARKVSDTEARGFLEQLAAAGLITVPTTPDAQVTVTDEGRQLHSRVHGAVSEITERLWGDLPAEDLASAARVLSTVLARANDELRAG